MPSARCANAIGIDVRCLTDVRHRQIHLTNPRRLLAGGVVDFGDKLADVIDMNNDGIHRQTRLLRQRMAFAHLVQRVANQLFNLFYRVGTACGGARTSCATTAKPFPCSPARAASTAALSAVDIGLESDGLNHAGNVFNAFRCITNIIHGGNCVGHRLSTLMHRA